MKISVTLWGELPAHLEKRGRHIDLEVDGSTTVGQLKEVLGIGAAWQANIDGQAALDKEPLREQADIAFLVPIEGG